MLDEGSKNRTHTVTNTLLLGEMPFPIGYTLICRQLDSNQLSTEPLSLSQGRYPIRYAHLSLHSESNWGLSVYSQLHYHYTMESYWMGTLRIELRSLGLESNIMPLYYIPNWHDRIWTRSLLHIRQVHYHFATCHYWPRRIRTSVVTVSEW